MNQHLAQSSRPEYTVIHLESSSEVPAQIASDLREIGVPAGLIGCEFRPLDEAGFLGGTGENGLVAFGASGLFGRIGIDVATGRVVYVPQVESTKGVADEIRELVSVLDASAVVPAGFWETFCDDVAMGDYADEDL
ncbi:SUKH-4 family immunity protein [Streptomyces sp. NPDC055815]